MPQRMVSMRCARFTLAPECLHNPTRGTSAAPRSPSVPMPKVVIYTTPFCPYCLMAKRLLTKKGVAFEEIDVSGDYALREEMTAKAGGRRTVPQIWIGDRHVGGSDDLYALEREGRLDALLAA
jgi:glutaredoxin 3